MKKTILIFAASTLLLSCNETTKTIAEDIQTETKIEDAIEYATFGAEITDEGAIDAKDLLAKLQTVDSIQVKVKTVIKDVCQKKGCWMTVPMTENTEMRVKFKDYDFFMPLNSHGKNVIFEGWAYKYTTPVSELQHYAEDAGASKEEIEAITESETGYEFLASGVLMY